MRVWPGAQAAVSFAHGLAPGYQAATRLVRVEPGTPLEVDLKLQRSRVDVSESTRTSDAPEVIASEPRAPERHADPAAPADRSRSLAPWLVAGTSAAVAIGGAVLLGIALSDMSDVENAGPTTDWSEVESKYERSPALSTAGIILIGAGVAGIAAGLTWHFLDDDQPERLSLRASPLALELHASF